MTVKLDYENDVTRRWRDLAVALPEAEAGTSCVKCSLAYIVLVLALSSCQTPPPQPALEQHTELAVADDSRLVVLLHGYGSDEKDLVGLAREVGLQGPLVSFRAPLPAGNGYAWFPINFDADPRYPPDAADVILPRLATNIRRAQLQQTAQEGVVIGFSQGATMTAMLAAEHPKVVTHAVVLSGGLPRPVRALKGEVDVFVAHGAADELVPVERGRALKDELKRAGRNVTYREFDGVGHAIPTPVRAAVRSWLAEP